jgi:chromosomal replication initiator protein
MRNMRVLYLSSEQFTNDLVEAIRTHTTDSFRDKYRAQKCSS